MTNAAADSRSSLTKSISDKKEQEGHLVRGRERGGGTDSVDNRQQRLLYNIYEDMLVSGRLNVYYTHGLALPLQRLSISNSSNSSTEDGVLVNKSGNIIMKLTLDLHGYSYQISTLAVTHLIYELKRCYNTTGRMTVSSVSKIGEILHLQLNEHFNAIHTLDRESDSDSDIGYTTNNKHTDTDTETGTDSNNDNSSSEEAASTDGDSGSDSDTLPLPPAYLDLRGVEIITGKGQYKHLSYIEEYIQTHYPSLKVVQGRRNQGVLLLSRSAFIQYMKDDRLYSLDKR